MLNMGGPSSLDEVEDFLTRLFTDKDIMAMPMQSRLGRFIAQKRTPKIKKKYAEIGGGSPILSWTKKQGQLMVETLDRVSPETGPHKYYIGFQYAKPLLEDTLEEMERDGLERAVAFSQFPQYSCSTSGSSFNSLCEHYLNRSEPSKLKWSFIDRWSTHPKLLECFADMIKKELQTIPSEHMSDAVILFSAHALPMVTVKRGDSYPTEVAATVLGVMEKLGWSHSYRLVWQSKVGPLEWLSPQTDVAMKALAKKGRRNLVLVPISFVNEHIETLHELDIEYGKEFAEKIGVKNLRRVPTPNDHPLFIEALSDLVKTHMNSGQIYSPQLMLRCPLCTKARCAVTRKWLSFW